MNHYERLSIQPEASADEVKQAYRRACSQHHPDRGGDAATMARINLAYECLSDPERRAAYDAAGFAEGAFMTIEAMATDALTQFFDEAIKRDVADIVAGVNTAIHAARAHVFTEKASREHSRTRLQAQRDRVRTKGGKRNIAHAIINPQIEQLNQQIAEHERSLAALDLAAEMLEHYEADEDERPTYRVVMRVNGQPPFGGGTLWTL